MDETKIEGAKFIHVISIAKTSEDNYIEVKTRIDPFSITSYYEGTANGYPVTIICSTGMTFFVKMTIDEADKMMNDIDRTMMIKNRW